MPIASVSLPVWQGSEDNSGLLFPVTLESVVGTDSDMRPHDITFFLLSQILATLPLLLRGQRCRVGMTRDIT